MKRVLIAGLVAGAAACDGGVSEDAAMELSTTTEAAATTDIAAVAPPPPVQARMATPAPPAPGAPPTPPRSAPSDSPATPPLGTPLLAYSYEYEVEAPAEGVRALLRDHERACQSAGPLTCQVIDSGVTQHGRKEVTAGLTFRATPAYVRAFRAGLEREVERARGEVSSSNIDTEDLTRSIVDTEARLRAGRLLRGRLEQLIASRPGNLAQLLEIERELARVQGEIDAAESSLAVMRARVAMSTVTLTYASGGAVVDPGDGAPLAQAGDSFAANLAGSLAAILTLISLLLPWAVVLALVAWGVWAVARRRRPNPPRPAPSRPVDFEEAVPTDRDG